MTFVRAAFHGGWCWNKLTPLLRAPGHTVWTPTLSGWKYHTLDTGHDAMITAP